jgi:endo-1,4-beta-xylanase
MPNGIIQRKRSRREESRPLRLEPLEDRLVCDASMPILGHMAEQVLAQTASATAQITGPNKITSTGFESNLGSWWTAGGVNLQATSAAAKSGSKSLLVSGRTQSWHGAYHDLGTNWTDGAELGMDAWVRLAGSGSDTLSLLLRQVDGRGETFHYATDNVVGGDKWYQLSAGWTLDIVGTLTDLRLMIVDQNPTTSFYVDDVSAGLFDWEAAANTRIEQIRKSDARINIVDQFGNPLEGATIELHQKSSEFGFGTAINHVGLANPTYAHFAANNFEWVTLEYEQGWPSNEPTRGTETYFVTDAMVAWAQANGMQLRGHQLFWSQSYPNWVPGLSNADLQAEMQQRLNSVLNRYRGDYAQWDVYNEMLHGNFYESRLGDSIVPWMFNTTKQLDPNTQLFLNDYNVLEGAMADDMVALVARLASQGVNVDGIGVQGHFPGSIEAYTILSRLDALLQTGLPVWATEFDTLNADENLRADQLEKFFRLAFSHSAMEGIMLWDFWGGSPGRDPSRALMDADGRLNAAGQRYLDLRAEWTTNISTTSATGGSLNWRGFNGNYDVIVRTADGQTITTNFTLSSGIPNQTFTVTATVLPRVAIVANDDTSLDGSYQIQVSALDYVGRQSTSPSFTYQIDWNSDGTWDQSITGGATVTATRSMTTLGSQNIRVRVSDSRGAASLPGQHAVAVTGFQVQTTGGVTNLIWSGTFGQDVVNFTRLTPTVVQADLLRSDGVARGISYGFEGITGNILTNGLGGADQIQSLTLSFIGPAAEGVFDSAMTANGATSSWIAPMSYASAMHTFSQAIALSVSSNGGSARFIPPETRDPLSSSVHQSSVNESTTNEDRKRLTRREQPTDQVFSMMFDDESFVI